MFSGDIHALSPVYPIFFFFFNDTATTEIYTLSLHDALPISTAPGWNGTSCCPGTTRGRRDRKSTRLNSSHSSISYAVFCLKKKKHYHTPSFTLKKKKTNKNNNKS